ncbi:CynX/NimT family MFS transporter [Methylobacterium oryzae]|uniref:MFS transporter n=1 Tax=Methylobacterium oryzae TaxID=334852 RepID=UPI002F35FEEE
MAFEEQAAGARAMTAYGRDLERSRIAPLLGIILVSLNLRAAATSVPPILSRVTESFPVTPATQSLLGTLPLLCFALFGILTPWLSRRIGLERSLIIAMVLVASGEIGRAGLSHSASTFIVLSVLCLGGMGMANVLVPPAVKLYFPDRIGLVGGIFQTLIVVSASVPSMIAVPASDALGWRAFVGIWGVLGALAVFPWLPLTRAPEVTASRPVSALQVARWPGAWAIMLVFSIGPLLLYSMIAWLPQMVTETKGVSLTTAATMLSVFNAIGLFHSFAVPNILARMKYPLVVVLLAALSIVCGALGLAYVPGSAWPWVLVIGLGAMLLNVGLTLVTMRCRTGEATTVLSGFVQSAGYLVSAVGPLTIGALRGATGGWMAPCWFLAGTALVAVAAGIPAARKGYLDVA